jgi:hypothetical protein
MVVMVYMDCNMKNLMHFEVHPEQPRVYANTFNVLQDPLELVHASAVTVMTEN